MDYETFSAPFEAKPLAAFGYRTLSAQFGDGYKQETGDGINTETQSWPLSFVGRKDEILPIRDFFRRQRGFMPFYWTPPDGERALFKCAGFNYVPDVGGNASLTATLELYYTP